MAPGELEADGFVITAFLTTRATDSELTDDDVIVRYDGEDVIGLTVLHAGRRNPA